MMVAMDSETTPRRIVILAFPGVQPLDVVGPSEVFSTASAQAEDSPYEVEVVAETDEAIKAASGGYGIVPGGTIADCRGPIDTLVVAGGLGVFAAEESEELISWIVEAAGRARRVTSVCSGAFLLARAGLLDGLRATSHWSVCAELGRRYPEVEVDDSPIFINDGDVWTSAGVTAGMDLSLALVASDLGEEAALEVARWLVLFLRRPGGQAQFSTHLESRPAARPGIRDLQLWIADHLEEDLRVEALAERASMSPRNFARAFVRETGVTPGEYVETLRVERARQSLEQDTAPIESVAGSCGFGTPETMRRAFSRRLRVSPAEYRARFRREPERAGSARRED